MRMIRSILVHLDASPASLPRLTLAHRLAEQHDAEVTALYAATPADLLVPVGLDVGLGAGVEAADLLQGLESSRRDRARSQYDAAVATGLSRLRWAEIDRDLPLTAFIARAFCADLLVLGQCDPVARGPREVPADFVEWVVIASGKPALVLPFIGAPAAPPQVVLLAWKPSRESARALAAALPLLQSAAQVHVASWTDPVGGVDDTGPQVLAYLQRHGVQAQWHCPGVASVEVGEALLSLASDLGADLLAMGCYGHSRAREWLLGGASRTVLRSMTVPVLMVH